MSDFQWPENTPVYAHEQVLASTADGREISVDTQLKDLLEALWQRSLGTEWSCQGGSVPGSVSQQGAWAEPSMFSSSLAHLQTPASFSDAHIIFSVYEDAVRFLKTTAIGITTDEHEMPSWSMALKAVPPHPAEGPWRAQVLWRHTLTERITQVWCAPERDQ